MTGFGVADGLVAGRRLHVEIRSVNHRFFHLATRLPPDLAPVEGELREALRRDFERGHVSVSARWADERGALPAAAELERTAAGLRELQETLGLDGGVTLELVLRHAASSEAQAPAPPPTALWAEVAPIMSGAAEACRVARRREGEVLAAELSFRLDAIERGAGEIMALLGGRLVRERDRLRANVAQLIEGHGIDDARVAHELALMADRLDVTEELVRLGAHLVAARAHLEQDAAAGKPLGFLAQEIGREINTIGSKANDAAIAHHVVAMKGDLEKFREQVENVE